MDSQKSLFLDTATQICRQWHSASVREEVKEQLADSRLYCSRYVKCQYKATLLNSLINFHNLCLYSEDFLEAMQKAKEGRYSGEAGGKLTPGVLARVVDIAYWISREYETLDEQIGRLKDLIEDGWEVLFEDGLELPLIDETSCVYAEGDPIKGIASGAYKPIRLSCRKDKPPDCKIKQFWDNNRIELEALAKMDINSIEAKLKDTNELKNVKEHAQAITKNDSPHGNRCTVALSDAVICIEAMHCPEPVAVHSINRKHFLPLGEVLGIECKP